MNTREPIDHCAIYYDLISIMDMTIKDIIPDRSPWKTATDARRYVSDRYNAACEELAEAHGIAVSTLKRKHAPGVVEYMNEAGAKFKE